MSEYAVQAVEEITTALERISPQLQGDHGLLLRKANRIQSIHSSLAMEANTLSLEAVTAILNGQHVVAPAHEIQEIKNAQKAYEELPHYYPFDPNELLRAHALLMDSLLPDAGTLRTRNIGVYSAQGLLHAAPPDRVPFLLSELLRWTQAAPPSPPHQKCHLPLRIRVHPPLLRWKWTHGTPLAYPPPRTLEPPLLPPPLRKFHLPTPTSILPSHKPRKSTGKCLPMYRFLPPCYPSYAPSLSISSKDKGKSPRTPV